MIAAIYARSTQQTATEKQKCIARIAQRHDFRGLIAAAALVSLTACATSQAPSAPVPLAKPEVQPADTIRFLTSEYDGRFTVTRLAGFVDLPTTELGEQIRKLLGDFGQSL